MRAAASDGEEAGDGGGRPASVTGSAVAADDDDDDDEEAGDVRESGMSANWCPGTRSYTQVITVSPFVSLRRFRDC